MRLAKIDASKMFYLTSFCCVANLVTGLLVLPSKGIAARLFSPLVFFVVRGLGVILHAGCLERWRENIDTMLDEVVRVEEEVKKACLS